MKSDIEESNDILTAITNWQDKDVKDDGFENVVDYVSAVLNDPNLADLAHARLYHMIETAGMSWKKDENGERHPQYNFFSNELFGMDEPLEKLVDLLLSGSRQLPARKRIIMLMGPVGGGKSTVASVIKKGLEEFTKAEQGRLYAIEGCPLHEDPLHLLPNDLREKIKEQHDILIEGDLCPMCRWRLNNEFQGDFKKFKVTRVKFSEQGRMGIGTFQPSDVKSQDIAELVGSINLSRIGDIGVESDPRAFSFDGELNVANRGVVEMIEMFKNDEKFLYVLLSLAQENYVKAPRFPLIYSDMVILSHTNETEWKKFTSKPENEALKDRIITIPFPYVLTVGDEIKIYEKELSTSKDAKDVTICPRTLDVCAMFAVLSRLLTPKDGRIDMVKKMKAYNGDDVPGISPAEVTKMRREATSEGMNGLGPRYITNCISQSIAEAREFFNSSDPTEHREEGVAEEIKQHKISVDAIDMMRVFTRAINDDLELTEEDKTRLKELLEEAKGELHEMLKEDVQKAFCYEFEKEADILFDNYISNAVAFINDELVMDPITGDRIPPDTNLMSSVEKMVNINESSARQFRQSIVNRIARGSTQGKDVDMRMHSDLRQAISKRIFEERRDTIQITTTAIRPDGEKLEELNRVIKRLVEQGYSHFSAARIVRYVGNLLNRG